MLPDWAPNAHPLIVHFPIALFVAAVLVDAVLLAMRKHDAMSAVLFVLAGVGALAAFLSGRVAIDSLMVPPHVVPDSNAHADWGLRAVWVVGLYGILRVVTWRLVPTWRAAVRIPLFLLSLVGLYVVWETAEHGGRLVFQHGLGTAVEATSVVEAPEPVAAGERLTGAWAWTPETGLGSLLQDASLNPDGANARIEYVDGQSVLAVDGPATILVADTTMGIQFDARLNTSQLEGSVFLVHNATDTDNFHYLRVGADLSVSQGSRANGTDSRMSNGRYPSSDWHTVRVVGETTHYRAYVDGVLVTHGHGDAAPAGRVGIHIEGGTVYLTNLALTPIG